MISFELKKYSNFHYNLTFKKLVHKRSGEIVEEKGITLYSIPLYIVKVKIANADVESKLGDKDVSLKEYLVEFYKSYKEVCELLKKIL